MNWGHLVGIAIGALAGGFGIFFAERSRQVRKLRDHIDWLRGEREIYRKAIEPLLSAEVRLANAYGCEDCNQTWCSNSMIGFSLDNVREAIAAIRGGT